MVEQYLYFIRHTGPDGKLDVYGVFDEDRYPTHILHYRVLFSMCAPYETGRVSHVDARVVTEYVQEERMDLSCEPNNAFEGAFLGVSADQYEEAVRKRIDTYS